DRVRRNDCSRSRPVEFRGIPPRGVAASSVYELEAGYAAGQNPNPAAVATGSAVAVSETEVDPAAGRRNPPATATSLWRPRPFLDTGERSPGRSSNCGRSGPGAGPTQNVIVGLP